MSENSTENHGYLVVRVSTALGAVPVAGAEVVVRDGERQSADIIYSAITSSVGLTPVITLPSPPRVTSESPGQRDPFATYILEVRASGYVPEIYNSIFIFEDITSYQNAVLVPLPDNASPDRYDPFIERSFESPPPEL